MILRDITQEPGVNGASVAHREILVCYVRNLDFLQYCCPLLCLFFSTSCR